MCKPKHTNINTDICILTVMKMNEDDRMEFVREKIHGTYLKNNKENKYEKDCVK